MLDSPERNVPQLDDATLDALLGRTLSRSASLRAQRSRRHAVAGTVVAVVALVAGLVVALPGATAPGARAGAPDQAGGRWLLVADVTEVSSWGTVTAAGFQPSLDLLCPAVGTCYADADGQVEFTHDGGTSWHQAAGVNTAPMMGDISCADAEHCSVLGDAAGGGSTFFTTSDGGATWTSHAGPQQITSVGIGTRLACVSAASCVVVSVDGGHGGAAVKVPSGFPSLVLTTSDGGDSWTQSSGLPDDIGPMEFSCQPSGTCVVSGLADASGQSADTTYVSSDGGNSWTPATLPSGVGPLMSVSCPTTSHCLAAALDAGDPGTGDELLASADGGTSWTPAPATGLPGSLLESVSCPSVSECWVGGGARPEGSSGPAVPAGKGQGMLAWSDDGGSTWQQASVPAGVGPVLDVTCPATTACYALGVEPSSSRQPMGTTMPVVLLSTARP